MASAPHARTILAPVFGSRVGAGRGYRRGPALSSGSTLIRQLCGVALRAHSVDAQCPARQNPDRLQISSSRSGVVGYCKDHAQQDEQRQGSDADVAEHEPRNRHSPPGLPLARDAA